MQHRIEVAQKSEHFRPTNQFLPPLWNVGAFYYMPIYYAQISLKSVILKFPCIFYVIFRRCFNFKSSHRIFIWELELPFFVALKRPLLPLVLMKCPETSKWWRELIYWSIRSWITCKKLEKKIKTIICWAYLVIMASMLDLEKMIIWW